MSGLVASHFGGADFTRENWAPMFRLVSGWDVPTDLYCLPPLRVATTRAGFLSRGNRLPVPGLLPYVRKTQRSPTMLVSAILCTTPIVVALTFFPNAEDCTIRR
jgi:hypothetical protein